MTDNPAKTEDQDPSMIERVAIALARHDGATYQDIARAAIAAMREPTRAMCKTAEDISGCKIDDHYVQPICSECARIIWQRMNDRSLKE